MVLGIFLALWSVMGLMLLELSYSLYVLVLSLLLTSIKNTKSGQRLSYVSFYFVDLVNFRGGLALLCKSNGMVNLFGSSHNYIDVCVLLQGLPEYRLTCFYSFPKHTRRSASWKLLKYPSSYSSLLWVVLGEKRGDRHHPSILITSFCGVVEHCELFEIPKVVYDSTSEKSKDSYNCVEEKFDRGLVSSSSFQFFSIGKILNEEAHCSDQLLLFLCLIVIRTFAYIVFDLEIRGWPHLSAGLVSKQHGISMWRLMLLCNNPNVVNNCLLGERNSINNSRGILLNVDHILLGFEVVKIGPLSGAYFDRWKEVGCAIASTRSVIVAKS
ncbi:hypothetical protein M5689_019717 [Euphorbia peplus]|nr:hypothetical protein M5689_019717 [Euphorbia peplus]